MWAFILFCISLSVSIYLYIKRNKIYDSKVNLTNEDLAEYDKYDKAFIIMFLITLLLVGISAYVLGWFDFKS